MTNIRDLMVELEGATPEEVFQKAKEIGSLPVRLAMLGLASIKKERSALWWNYPPGVFIGYKWESDQIIDLTKRLSACLKDIGYKVFLDREELSENSDAYYQIPSFITNLHVCNYYLLLLTEKTTDFIFARKGKTSWIFDEYQHAVRLANSGRLFIVPILVEPRGLDDYFLKTGTIDISKDLLDLEPVLSFFSLPDDVQLSSREQSNLDSICHQFDRLIAVGELESAQEILYQGIGFKNCVDFIFRQLIYHSHLSNHDDVSLWFNNLRRQLSPQQISHIYKGYNYYHGLDTRLEFK